MKRPPVAALALSTMGLLVVVASFWTWGTCPTTPCGGNLMAIAENSGLDIGFGVVTALAGLLLAFLGLAAIWNESARVAVGAAAVSALIVLAAGAAVASMYGIPGQDEDFHWPLYVPVGVAVVGVIALATAAGLRRAESRRQ